MSVFRVHRTLPRLKTVKDRQYATSPLLEQNEYTETPEYPPILDTSLQARKLRERSVVYKKIQKIKTVEEKQIGLNMPKYYGWKCVMFHENRVPFNAMPMVQHYTRSHFVPIKKLPDIYTENEPTADAVAKEIKSQIEEVIAIEHEGINRNFTFNNELTEAEQKEDALSKCIVRQINRIITNNLADKTSHILSAQVDYDPRHEAFWMVGGVDPPTRIENWRKSIKWLKDRAEESVDRPVQYLGSPFLAMRTNLPLKPIIPYSEAVNPDFRVPKFSYLPQTVGYTPDHRHGTNIPGFWPGDSDEFGLLSIHGRGHILARKETYGEQDNVEALHCQAMKASFGWLLAQASYQGFTTYNDITYPLATQTLITNGQLWSLYAYQLNTISFHNDQYNENLKSNVCFGTEPLKLYEKIENGKVVGLDENVLKMIIQLYLNEPEERSHKLKPYLGTKEQMVADIESNKRRIWLEATYKHLMANRPRHNLVPEVYQWEMIYKIFHQTRFIEPRRRPFELGINPFQRRLDEHLPPYIPKVLRPFPNARKFEQTFYPDVKVK